MDVIEEPIRIAAWSTVAGLQAGVAFLIARLVRQARDSDRKAE